MTRKQALKMINRLEKQINALDYFVSVSRFPRVRDFLSLQFDLHDRKEFLKNINSLKNDLILTIVACKKDTL